MNRMLETNEYEAIGCHPFFRLERALALLTLFNNLLMDYIAVKHGLNKEERVSLLLSNRWGEE